MTRQTTIYLPQSRMETHAINPPSKQETLLGRKNLSPRISRTGYINRGTKLTALLIEEPVNHFSNTILLSTLGDMEKLSILQATMDKSLIISEILSICNLPSTSGYRKVNQLIKDKLLIPDGFIIITKGKNNIHSKVTTYRSITSKINIEFGKDHLSIKLRSEETTKQ